MVVEEWDQVFRSPTMEIRVPRVVALRQYAPISAVPKFCRRSILLRDRYKCQYCGERFESQDLTFDHVIPRSKGGMTTWENVVAACSPCNLRKADRLPVDVRMWPASAPFQPSVFDLHQNGRLFPPNYLHHSWMDYLYWDSVLDP